MLSYDWVFPLLMVAIFAFAIVLVYLQRKKQQELLQEQAEKRNGYIESSNILRPVTLVLPLGNQSLYVYTVPGGKNRPSKTIADLTDNSATFPQIKLGRNTLFQKALETFGKERFLTSDEEFDNTFVVNTDDDSSSRRVLTAEIQKNLVEMASKSPSVEIKPQHFRLMVLRILKDSEGYDLFIDTALAILRQLK